MTIAAPVATAPAHGCPRCKAPLAAHPIAPDVTVYACEADAGYRGQAAGPPTTCRGVFISPYAWSRIVGQPVLAEALDARLAPGMTRGGLVPMLRCPVCTLEMERGPFAARSNIVIDVCPQNHGMWLDAGELPGTLNYIMAAPPPGVVVPYEATLSTKQIREQIDFQVLKIESDASQRKARAKEIAVLIGLLVVALRVGYWVVRVKHQPARPPIPTVEIQSQ